jgi:alkylation response protein AidB-like acyl-CoA dehydrogenase
MFCLARTSWEGRRQAGITFLLLDMDTPGLSVRPIVTLAGDHEVNQVFFEGARVPKANRVGEENAGWTVAKALLEFERGGAYAAGLQAALRRLRTVAAEEPADGGGRLLDDPAFARRLAEAEIDLMALEITEQRVMASLSAGGAPGPASSLLKTRGTEALQVLDELAVAAAGHYAGVEQRAAREPGANVPIVGPGAHLTAMPRYLNDRAASIYGGSNEIQRNIMASLVLGL